MNYSVLCRNLSGIVLRAPESGLGPILDWLAANGWTDVERVALALPIDALKERGHAAGQWLNRNLGSRGDLKVMFKEMLPDWTGTIGELLEVIEAI